MNCFFVFLEDVKDPVLNVDHDDISAANQYLCDLAFSKGVKRIEEITFKAKRLGIIYACYSCCLRCVGTDGGAVFNGERHVDVFAEKLKYYREELKELAATVSAADFAPGMGMPGVANIPIGRG